MKGITTVLMFVLGLYNVSGQISAIAEKFALPASLSESSGAVFFNDKLISHNDSGGENKLYELDTISGLVTRTVTISNATNIDWEDITQDNTSIYVGDIGNNVSGNRTDLKVYKISKSDYLTMEAVVAETIAFSYSDQTDFTAQTPNTTKWDAEALVSFDASHLILFTKNWVSGTTKAYLVSKTPGTYALTPLTTTLNSGGLISGGTYNPLTGKLYLVGYTNVLMPFIWVCQGFNGNDIFSGTNTQTNLSSLSFEQAESIAYVNENKYFITSESFSQSIISDYAKLIAFSTNDVALSIKQEELKKSIALYPNPVNDILHIENGIVNFVEIYDTRSILIYKGNFRNIKMSGYSKGIYIVKIAFNDGFFVTKKIIKI